MTARITRWAPAALALLTLLGAAAWAQELPPPEKRGEVAPADATEAGDEEAEWTVFEDIVAWVNDDIITLNDLSEAEQELSAVLYGRFSGEELEQRLTEGRERLLYSLIESRLLIQEAERLYDVPKLRQSLVDQFRERQGIESDEEMSQLLRQQGLTQEELADKLSYYSIPGFVIQYEVTDRLSVSDEEVEAYFAAHQEELSTPTTVSFRELALKEEGKDAEAVRKQAESLVEQARAGADFVELVSTHSDSPSSAMGGLIGPLAEGDLAPWLVAPALGVEVGAVSDPVETPYGWVILRIESREGGEVAGLDERREEIEQLVRQEKYVPALEEFILTAWNRSNIVVNGDFVDRLPPEWQGRVLAE